MRRFLIVFFLLSRFSFAMTPTAAYGTEEVFLLAGAASLPPMQELVKEFTAETGIPVQTNFGGSGELLSQYRLTGRGDLYFPGSVDFMTIARRDGLIDIASETTVVYLMPAINVRKGNPLKITSLEDLARPGVRVVIGNPESVCLGVFAVEMAESSLTPEQKLKFRANIRTYASSCSAVANAIVLDTADAVIGWRVFKYWNPEAIENVSISKREIPRVSYLSIAVTAKAKNPDGARKLIEFMLSEKGLKHFRNYHYFTTAREALDWLGADKPIGGECYKVPEEWMQ